MGDIGLKFSDVFLVFVVIMKVHLSQFSSCINPYRLNQFHIKHRPLLRIQQDFNLIIFLNFSIACLNSFIV